MSTALLWRAKEALDRLMRTSDAPRDGDSIVGDSQRAILRDDDGLPSMDYLAALTEATVLPQEVAILVLQQLDLNSLVRAAGPMFDVPVVRVANAEVGVSQTPRLSEHGCACLRKIVLSFESCDQGWSSDDRRLHGTYEGSWTWFTLAVLRDDRVVRTWELQRNRHAVKAFERYRKVIGRDHELFDHLLPGDALQLRAAAHFPGWVNHCKAASIELECAYNFTSIQPDVFEVS